MNSSTGDAHRGGQILDLLDGQLLEALRLDGRVPLSRVAEVLGTTNQTVARRYRRLRDTGTARVIGRLDSAWAGCPEWVVRIGCTPDAALPLARSLAARPDCHWVQVVSGGTEIACEIQKMGELGQEGFDLDELVGEGQITGVSAHCVLHRYRTRWSGPSLLSAEQAERLVPPAVGPEARGERFSLGREDLVMLDLLALDGRASNTSVANATGWHESTVRRRIARLRAGGALEFRVDVDRRAFGFPGLALLWISISPDQLAAVGEALAGHPETVFAVATTGKANLLASVAYRDNSALYRAMNDRLGGFPGICRIETAPVVHPVKD